MEVMRARGNLKPGVRVPVNDICEIAHNKVFKGKRKQQARRKVAKEATEQSAAAVGRASTVKRPAGANNTRQASVEDVRALFRRVGAR